MPDLVRADNPLSPLIGGTRAALGRRIIELGAERVICGRRLELLETTAPEIRRRPGGQVSAIRCDVCDATVDAMMDAIRRNAPRPVTTGNSRTSPVSWFRIGQDMAMARWWCSTAARICVPPGAEGFPQ